MILTPMILTPMDRAKGGAWGASHNRGTSVKSSNEPTLGSRVPSRRIVGCWMVAFLLWVAGAKAGEPLVERDVPVTMSDGTILRAHIFRPDDQELHPVLVMRTPYGKPARPEEALLRAGFIVVVQDARGRHGSGGEFESFVRAETHDGSDGFDTIEWAAKLPGSNGKVGLYGASYPAYLAWRAAGKQPPSLAAMAAFSIPISYLDLEGPGSIRPGRRLKWWQSAIRPEARRRGGQPGLHTADEAKRLWNEGEGRALLGTLPWRELPDELFGTEAPFVKGWLQQPTRSPWHLDQDASRTTVPNLNVCGWYDHCIGSLELHLAISKAGGSFNAKRYSRLVIGPWSHNALGKRGQGEFDFGPSASLELAKLQAEWFGFWLRGDKNEVARWAPIRLFVTGANEWRNFHEWPPKYASPREWFLASAGAANTPAGNGSLVDQAAPADGHDTFEYDPHNPVPTLWTEEMFTMPGDQRRLSDRPDILVYQSPPLAADIETIGYPELQLHAASSCPDTDFLARLVDVAPDGRALDVAVGIVRARYRQGLDQPLLLVPNEATEFRIRMRPTAHRFLAGHRIRVDVTSSDFPNYDRHHNTAADQNADAELVTARQTVFHGPTRASRLTLPIMPGHSDVPVWARNATKVAPPRPVMQWGTQGDAPGELHSPIGLAIDRRDQLHVTEFKNKRVQVFDTDGHSLRTFPVPSEPGGIAIDGQGRIYVALMIAHQVAVFDADGKPLAQWGKMGAAEGDFNQPGGIAVAPDGTIHVVDQANHRVQRFSPDGKFLGAWGEHGSQPGQFGGDGPKGSRLSGPHFACFDASGRIFTTEGANLRVQIFDATGTPSGGWSGIGAGAGGFGGRPKDRTNPFEGPIGITIDRLGRVWVSSTNNRVQCFSPGGEFLTGIGDEGGEPGQFIIPHGLAIDSQGFLYVVDSSNQRIQKFAIE